MAYSVKKSTLFTLAGISALVLLSACSRDQHYKRQINGDDTYLQSAELKELKAPAGSILPLQNGEYAIPGTVQGQTGKQLDIRPPSQPLALIDGTRTQLTGNTGLLLFSAEQLKGPLWPQIVSVMKAKNFAIAQQQEASQTLTTDWVEWQRADEDLASRGRYQISVRQQGAQQLLTVRLLELEQAGKKVAIPAQTQRYTAQMVNEIVVALSSQLTTQQNDTTRQSQNRIEVQSGSDETGLPNVILRAPYAVTWQRLPEVMQRIGMKVTDSSQSKGSMEVSYSAPDASAWAELGVTDPQLPEGDYKVQVGDLDNRSSLQFIAPKSRTLTQSQNDALVEVLQAAFRQ